jgi:hypothetical protein
MKHDRQPEDRGPLVQTPGKVLPRLVQPRCDRPHVLRRVVTALDELGRVRQDPVDVGKDVVGAHREVVVLLLELLRLGERPTDGHVVLGEHVAVVVDPVKHLKLRVGNRVYFSLLFGSYCPLYEEISKFIIYNSHYFNTFA